MEKKTIIWHTRDEEPKDFADVVLLNSKTGDFASFFTPFPNFSFESDQWAYVSDLVLASKALDVAIESLTKIWKQPEDMADARDAEDTLKKINEIMKG